MADKKLNEVTKVTDMAYVPVIMEDGSIGQIAKEDLASVVAYSMGFIFYSNVLNIGDSVTINKGYGILIINNISSGKSAVYGIANGNFDLLSSKDETMITISPVSEYSISLTNMNNSSVTLQARIL